VRFGVAPGDTTAGRGRVFFDDPPDAGKYTSVKVQSTFDFSHRYVLRAPGVGIANEIVVDLQSASYRYGGNRQDLHLRGVVAKTERNAGIAVGDQVRVSLHDVSDGDRLTITVVSSSAGRTIHLRQEENPRELKLKVTAPKYCIQSNCVGIRG
jgi:hypothetical protein